ncbi:MAG TPA: hypothetical protein VMW23_01895 [Sedimentisphaerales bacterium]|nr:hypothetical protein [Sedimentisphaerales bacterium]
MESDHFQIVDMSINGRRAVDEQTFASVEVLGERLDRVRKLGKMFEKVGFSRAVKHLSRQHKAAAVV